MPCKPWIPAFAGMTTVSEIVNLWTDSNYRADKEAEMTDQNPCVFDEKIVEIFHTVKDHLQEYRRSPVATYRLQFNPGFTFADATSIVHYLHELGISDCYASPYFRAKKGSLHGYDLLDHNCINPEIGTEDEYHVWVAELRTHGMGQVLDIVPNHMRIAGGENVWWTDVLENGPISIYADFFDIDWHPVKIELKNKVLLPILGDPYGRALESQELNLTFEEGAFFVHYYDNRLPVAPLSYRKILKLRIDELEKRIGSDHPSLQELLSIVTALDHLPPRTEESREKIMEGRREKEIIKKRLSTLYHESEVVHAFIDENIMAFNGTKDDPRSFDLLDDLLNDQAYRLAHWRVATEEINYRRFFDINELAAIRMEQPHVFREAHRLVFQLIREGKVTGLRMDHLDGLYNPVGYLYRLQRECFIQSCLRAPGFLQEEMAVEEKAGRLYDEELSRDPVSPLRMSFYMLGEKILIKSERIPEDWPIFGTTGYDFLNSVNGLFIDMLKARDFEEIFARFIRKKVNYQDLVYDKKKLIMQTSMTSEINTLGHFLNHLSEKDRHTRDFTLNSLTAALVEVIACFPVYRTYVTRSGVNERDRRYIEQAVSRAKRKNPAISALIFDFVQKVLLLEYPEYFGETDRMEWLDFVMRFQQLTGPVMAKGVEDTVFYVYNRFVSLNEVGGSPERFGTSLETFHGQNIERAKFWPHAMITTMTHDAKRSEDVRARLNVLSEIPGEWRESFLRWSRMNKKKKRVIDGQWIPDRNEEYLLYQTLVGVWPLDPMTGEDYETFKGRIKEYMLKAAREAKVNTSWISPNRFYEEGLLDFIDAVLDPSPYNPFLTDFGPLQERVSYFGMFNSLSQILLKITSPGIPDFYQGTEIWNFFLVDPDNRRPVDFTLRKEMLRKLEEEGIRAESDRLQFTRDLLKEWRDGSVKLYLTRKALRHRKEKHRLFMEGSYVPLEGEGALKEYLCAFCRQREEEEVLVVVPRFLTHVVRNPTGMPLGEEVWRDTRILLPDEISGETFHNVFTGERLTAREENGKKRLNLCEVFASFPVAMLERI
jgi:(1->4)-alpha-D-glucan 1-alpha-D-glucosylmutase